MLDKELLSQYIGRPDLLGEEDVRILSGNLEKNPYCHLSRLLFLKALYNTGSFSYAAELSRGAAFVAHRRTLFELVSPTERFRSSDFMPEPRPADPSSVQDLSQWIEKQDSGSMEELIDRFIRTNPRIKPASENITASQSDDDLPKPSSDILSTQVMTETLARIYLRQKKYDRAVDAYRILMLKNPKKSSFFADRIREIENLKDKN